MIKVERSCERCGSYKYEHRSDLVTTGWRVTEALWKGASEEVFKRFCVGLLDPHGYDLLKLSYEEINDKHAERGAILPFSVKKSGPSGCRFGTSRCASAGGPVKGCGTELSVVYTTLSGRTLEFVQKEGRACQAGPWSFVKFQADERGSEELFSQLREVFGPPDRSRGVSQFQQYLELTEKLGGDIGLEALTDGMRSACRGYKSPGNVLEDVVRVATKLLEI